MIAQRKAYGMASLRDAARTLRASHRASGLTQRPQAAARLPQAVIFVRTTPLGFTTIVNQLTVFFIQSLMFLRQVSYYYFDVSPYVPCSWRVIDHLYNIMYVFIVYMSELPRRKTDGASQFIGN
ncbi:hypothetical protein KBT16_14605, partial [Nostoc sp. CCCryo 231-06]|nr:hypothetical protein [Nostoc sp. CCCryo 231-06]